MLVYKNFSSRQVTRNQQLCILENLLNQSIKKLNILDQYVEGLSQQQQQIKHTTLLSRYHWYIEYDLKSYISEHTPWMEGRSEMDSVFWKLFKKNQPILKRNYHMEIERMDRTTLTEISNLNNNDNNSNNKYNSIKKEKMDIDSVDDNNSNSNNNHDNDNDDTIIPIDMAIALVSKEELKMLIDLYNDCFIFTCLPSYLCLDFQNEDPVLRILIYSILCLMITHTSNLHRFHIDHCETLSKTFYHHGLQHCKQHIIENKYDILTLHTAYNYMLYENENGYHHEAIESRKIIEKMIITLHDHLDFFTPWQSTIFRQLIWAIFIYDTTSNHDIRISKKIMDATYMGLEKQRATIADLNITDQMRADYIFFRCRLAFIMEHISKTCYQLETSSVDGRDVKEIEDDLWSIYNILPSWVNSTIGIKHVVLKKEYHHHDDENMNHPVCKHKLKEVWMRRLRYHFLIEWHGAFLYLYQVLLPHLYTTTISLQVIRVIQHSQIMTELLYLWAEDYDFFDCYCFPALHSIYLATNTQLYLSQSSHKIIREKSLDVLLKLFFVIQRSNMYHMYRHAPFIVNIRNALDIIHQKMMK
ncbi:unnamed protein product [Cunninghamella blakesleeana]